MEALFRLKQMILKAYSIIGMAFYGMGHTRLPTDEGQRFMTGNNQEHQMPAVSYTNNAINPIPQVTLHPERQGFNSRCDFDGSHQVPLQRVVSYIDRFTSLRRRKDNHSSDTLRRIFCWVVTNILLTCGIVIGLLFLLKYVDSPLLYSQRHNGIPLIPSSDPKACTPCTGSQHNQENPSKLPGCCTVNQEALQKLIEKMTKETVRDQLSETPYQRNLSGGHQRSTEGQNPCGALFFLYDDANKHAATIRDGYTVLRGWDADHGNVAYKHRCIDYDDSTGNVTISQSGFYLVYSHLAFIWKNLTDPNSPKSTILGQKVLVDMSINEPIAQDTRAIQPADPKVGNIASYNSRTMTIVHLQSGSKLTVSAKPSDLVIRNNAASSFGLYKL